MPVQFVNEDVAAKFEACRENDGKIHIPAGKHVIGQPRPVGYAGPLSRITMEAAEKALASGSNILKLKEEKPAAAKKAKGEEGK